MAKPGFYAVAKGRAPGVYRSWDDCDAQVRGFAGAKYKKFPSLREARAYIDMPASPSESSSTRSSAGPVTKAAMSHSTRNTAVASKEEEGWDVVYSDGACKGNGKTGSVAGIGVWWGHDDPRNLAERCPGSQTNNRAELIAIARVLESTPSSETPLMIKTDSTYSIKCLTEWLPGWERRGWKTSGGKPVLNIGIIRYIVALLELRYTFGQRVRFVYVKGHAGIEGNEGADGLANIGVRFPEVPEQDWETKRRYIEKAIKEIEEEEEPEVADKNIQTEFATDDEEFWREAEELDLDALDAPPPDSAGSRATALSSPRNGKSRTPVPDARITSTASSASRPSPAEYDEDEYGYDDLLDPDDLEAELAEAQGL
ncbi:hypothetical protein M0805_008495 [Coniferiporia weirii]|nr:hypothetical protein M0805_008495 [Coniferiporia weirii]